ncbi:MAG: response regulator, partial [Bryobacteraceae bacterium]
RTLKAPAPAAELAGVPVLIVDDHQPTRAGMESLLAGWNMHVDTAANASEALARAEANPYRLVILDHGLPDADGFELAPRLAEYGAAVVLLTSLPARGHAAQARRAGIAGYLTKPVRRDHLERCLRSVLGLAPEGGPAALITRHEIESEQRQLRARVLLAEDNLINQKLATRLLEKRGLRVDVVSNGREAVEAVSNSAYDLVLMDCQMPELDGLAATRQIRSLESALRRRTPIIAMTAHAFEEDRERCLEAGLDDYVAKPIQPELLFATLDRWLQ